MVVRASITAAPYHKDSRVKIMVLCCRTLADFASLCGCAKTLRCLGSTFHHPVVVPQGTSVSRGTGGSMYVLAEGDKARPHSKLGTNQLCRSQPWGWITRLRGASAEALMTFCFHCPNIIQDLAAAWSQEYAYLVHEILESWRPTNWALQGEKSGYSTIYLTYLVGH